MKLYRMLLLILVCALLAGQTPAQTQYKDLKYPTLHDIKIPPVQRSVLANGMVVYLVEDHELPVINARVRIGVGSIDDPSDKIGLASITGSVMRTGGTAKRTGDQIDAELESIAASVETGIDLTSGYAVMSVLKENTDTGLDVLADVLMNPAFPQEKLDLQKIEDRSLIARRNDDVGDIAGREFDKLIYGSQSAYARVPEYATIDAIKREDLIAFHKKYFYPNNVMIGVSGDFDSKEMLKKIESAFKNWNKGQFQRPMPPAVAYKFDYSVNFIRKEDVNQSNILIGHVGGMLNNPDFFALQVMNDVLSGGFQSRLFGHVRSDQGLAYSVFGRYGANFDYPGEFYAGAQTKSETTVKTIKSILHEIEQMKSEEISDAELARAKESYLNSFVFNFDTKGEVVSRLMTYEYYGYPRDFLEKTKANIEKVTKADVLRVAQKYLQPDKVRILVVGRDKDFDEPLSTLGKVNEIDITIPVPKEEKPKADQSSLNKGRDLLKKAVDAAGGAAAFHNIKTAGRKLTTLLVSAEGNLSVNVDLTIKMPDKMRINLQTPMGSMTQLLLGSDAWLITPEGANPAPDQMKTEIQAGMWREFTVLFAQAENPDLQVQYLGSEQVSGKKADVIQITPKDVRSYKLYLDPETNLPIKTAFDSMTSQGPVKTEQVFSDYRDVSGLKLPYKSVASHNGLRAQDSTVNEILINPPVDESLFAPPKK
jgi:predicted Zn-dependent peptidase